MAITLAEIQRYIADGEQEGLRLDFKRGDALANDPRKRLELVKDVSGLANADGGRLIYGIDEMRRGDGIPVASALSPVLDPATTKDWITQVVSGNTGPSLSGFDVQEVVAPDAAGGGRIVVIDIDAASTAHQNHLDQKYYQRAGVTTRPMMDFQIRDVMNRGVRPVLKVEFQKHLERKEPRTVGITPVVSNVGQVTLERWIFEIELPALAVNAQVLENEFTHSGVSWCDVNGLNGVSFYRFTFARTGSPGTIRLPSYLHPGQKMYLGRETGVPLLRLEVTEESWRWLHDRAPPIEWRIYMSNSRPMVGEVPFAKWCDFF